MLTPGGQIELAIEKPAAGGRMIGRHEGQVILVEGAIPGERVAARIDRVERQLAFATTVAVLDPSPDRRAGMDDPLCGGCLYSHIAYPRQLTIKADVVRDAFARLGRIPLETPLAIAASPERDYRMRGRLHVRDGRAGYYREGTHILCDPRSTGQLSDDAVRAAGDASAELRVKGAGVASVVVAENIPASERALYVELEPGARADPVILASLVGTGTLTGIVAQPPGGARTSAGTPAVADTLASLTRGRAGEGALHRHAESFFQANRFLLPDLVVAVLDAVPDSGEVLDLYAGVGLFSVALAATGRARIVAVEGARSSRADLQRNAGPFTGAVRVVPGRVEDYLQQRQHAPETIIVDPPRTGISRDAMLAVARLGARRVLYVSCDPPTMARDARRLLDAGYQLESLRGFDLFPNTPHVETVGVFSGASVRSNARGRRRETTRTAG